MTDYQDLSVLLVEDEKDLRQLFIWEFEDNGIPVDVVGSVDEAKQKLKGKRYDVILSDLKMPGENGVELMRYLVHEKAETKLRYLMSAFNEDDLNLEELQVNHFFKKPIKTSEVVHQIKTDHGKLGD